MKDVKKLSAFISAVSLSMFLFFGAMAMMGHNAAQMSHEQRSHAAHQEGAAALPCPLGLSSGSICPLMPFDHAKHFKSLLLSTIPSASILIIIIAVVAAVLLKRLVISWGERVRNLYQSTCEPPDERMHHLVIPLVPHPEVFARACARLYA